MKDFPVLYKKTSTGVIQFWHIWTTGIDGIGLIATQYGQMGTESPQNTTEEIKEGKNAGKKNATTAVEQAEKESKSRWEKQKKKGYVESVKAAEAEEVDELIEGGIVPMLAHTFEKQGHKIKYPALIQKKYDGTRMIAILKNRKCTLWSRTRKPINSLPHIIEEIERHFIADIILDGEAYNDKFKDNFEHIIHLVRQEEPDKECTDVQFHIYDMVSDETFDKRSSHLNKCFTIGNPKLKYLIKAETFLVENEEQVTEYFESFRRDGYEGAILRNADGLYVNKRSSDLIKIKEMEDAEFKIIGIEEGRGKLFGHVGAFVCKMPNGNEFLAKMSGDTEKLKEYFQDHSLWKGKQLTVKYQGLTAANGVPRFPVGIRIRNE